MLTSGPMPAAIDTTGLAKRYGQTTALAGLTMRVASGHVFGFLGPNGAGKTTAVKLLLGLARPTAGHATVLGAPLGDRATRRRIGYLPELFRYQAWLTARDVLGLHASLAGLPRDRRGVAIEDALGLVGLSDRGSDRVGTFSKGMQQRLGLGVALLGKPDLVFLDEPTSALDPIGRQDVRAVIRELRDRGSAVFLNSHLLTEVERVCDEVAIVDRGTGRRGWDARRAARRGDRARPGDGPRRGRRGRVWRPSGRSRTTRRGSSSGAARRSRVPDLVAAIVAAGGRIHAVDAGRETLEERFLELLGHPADEEPDAWTSSRTPLAQRPRHRPPDAPRGTPATDPAGPRRADGRHRRPDRLGLRGHRRQRPRARASPELEIVAGLSQLLILVAFMFSFVLAMTAAFLGSPAIAADLESGVLLAIAARPIRRAEILARQVARPGGHRRGLLGRRRACSRSRRPGSHPAMRRPIRSARRSSWPPRRPSCSPSHCSSASRLPADRRRRGRGRPVRAVVDRRHPREHRGAPPARLARPAPSTWRATCCRSTGSGEGRSSPSNRGHPAAGRRRAATRAPHGS